MKDVKKIKFVGYWKDFDYSKQLIYQILTKHYDVKIVDSGEETTVTTTETEPIEILKEAGITFNSDDKMNLDSFEQGEGGTIVIRRFNSISIEFDGKIQTYGVYAETVGEALSEIGAEVDENDEIDHSFSDKIQNGMVINIVSVFSVSLTVDGKTSEYEINKGKVADLIKLAGISLGKNDRTEPSLDSELKDGMTVKVVRAKSKSGFSVGQKISGKYSHYCACATCNGNSRGITSSGKKIYNGMKNPYYVACNWLPLGSVIKIDGKEYTVVDRGGSGLSRKGRVDIFTPEGHSACYKYGVGSCSIEIVRLGW